MSFRPIRPAQGGDVSTLQNDDDADGQKHQPQQSTGASSKTPVACWECRKKKTKARCHLPLSSSSIRLLCLHRLFSTHYALLIRSWRTVFWRETNLFGMPTSSVIM